MSVYIPIGSSLYFHPQISAVPMFRIELNQPLLERLESALGQDVLQQTGVMRRSAG